MPNDYQRQAISASFTRSLVFYWEHYSISCLQALWLIVVRRFIVVNIKVLWTYLTIISPIQFQVLVWYPRAHMIIFGLTTELNTFGGAKQKKKWQVSEFSQRKPASSQINSMI